jgi:ATP-dependent Clp protease ATP-binding subunit ClpX
MTKRQTFCSFCRKSYRDVGPLVEGPGEVYICGECVELCRSIIDQEKRRRGPQPVGPPPHLPSPEEIVERLSRLVPGQPEAVRSLAAAVHAHFKGPAGPRRHVLLHGPSRSSQVFLARALAHVCGLPFGQGEPVGQEPAGSPIPPLLQGLLEACDYDFERARLALVFVADADQPAVQRAVVKLLESASTGTIRAEFPMDTSHLLFLVGGRFAGLEPPGGAAIADALVARGIIPELVGHLAFARPVAPISEDTLQRIMSVVSWERLGDAAP